MATLQEIIAKRNELQKTNPNATNVEARQALMGTPATAPTAQVTPTTISPTVNVADQMAGKSVAERQAIRNGQPAPVTPPAPVAPPVTSSVTPSGATMNADGTVTPAPVTPNTPVTTTPPVEVKPTEPVKPVTPTTPTVDYTQAQGREQEIKTNVEGFIKSGMSPDKVRESSGYAQATPEKRAIIDGLLGGAASGSLLNEKDVLNAMISGVSVPKQNTQAYRNAEIKAGNYRKFNSMTPTQLLDNLKMGQIGTEMDQLLSQNPNYVQAKQKLNEFQKVQNLNNTMSNIVKGINGKEVVANTAEQEEVSISDQLIKKFGLDDANASAFAQFVATDEEMADNKAKLLSNKNALSNVNRQIADATTLLNKGIKDLKAQYPDMSASGIITLMGSRLAEFNDAITNLNSTKTLLTADIKDGMDLAKSAFDAKSEDIQAQNKIRSTMALNEYQSDFEKQQAEAALNDPKTQIKSTMDEFAKLGIVAQGDLTSKIAEFKKSGKTLPEYITGLRQQFMSKPEYKKYLELQSGQLSDAQKMSISQNFDLKKMGIEQNFQMKLAQAKQTTNNKWTKLDDGMYTNESGDIVTADELKNAKLLNNSYINKPVGAEGGECGFYASRGTGMSATPGGNSKEARFKAFSETTPQVGGMAFFGGDGYDKTYGHIAIVTGVNADGTITVKDSNYRGDGKVTERTVPASQVSGYYNNTPLAKGVNTQQQPTGQYSESDIELFSEIAAMDGSVQNTALKNSNLTRQQLAEYTSLAKAGKIPPTESQKQAALGTMSNIQGIAELDWTDAVGKFDYSRILGLQDSENARALIDNIRNSSALNNLGMLKGPMSDKDVEFIKSVSSKLDPVQSNAQFEKNIVEMYNIAARKVGANEIKNLSEIPEGRILPGQQTNTNTGGGQTQTYQGYTITGL